MDIHPAKVLFVCCVVDDPATWVILDEDRKVTDPWMGTVNNKV